MRDALDARKSRLSGGRRPKRLNQQLFQPLLRRLTLLRGASDGGRKRQRGAAGRERAITAAVAAENSRIMGILNCEGLTDAKNRPACWPKPPV